MNEIIYILIDLNDFNPDPIYSSFDRDKVVLEVGRSALCGDPTDGYRILEIAVNEVQV